MICVHCNNLYLLFPQPRTFLSQILSTWFTAPLPSGSAQISLLREAFLPMFFKQQPPPQFLAPDSALFFLHGTNHHHIYIYMPASSLPPSTKAEFICFVLCLFICPADLSWMPTFWSMPALCWASQDASVTKLIT